MAIVPAVAGALSASLRGAIGFLTRLPVGQSDADWDAFRGNPVAFPLAGYVIGVLLALPFALPAPDPAQAFGFLAAVYLVTGVNHVDGLADLGDAAAVHGAERRRDVLKDTRVGVGALVAVAVSVAGLALAALTVADLPFFLTAVGLVVAAEVGAKLGMATLACLGTPAHEGFGAQFTNNTPRDLAVPVFVALPAAILVGPASLIAVLVGPAVALGLRRWARPWLGGVSGDLFGATNEIGRLVALHAGVMVWTLW